MLVTGGLGFIGSAFAKRAASAGNKVVVLDLMTYAADPMSLAGQNGIEIVHRNISDTALVAMLLHKHDIDTVVNFAAESHVDRSIEDPPIFVDTNVMGTLNILNAINQMGKRLIQISTDEVYGSIESG